MMARHGSGVYVDASEVMQDALFEAVCDFFAGHGVPVDTAPGTLTLEDWQREGALEVCVLPAAASRDGAWLLVTDTAAVPAGPASRTDTNDSEWVERLAEHCHRRFCADCVWYWMNEEAANPGLDLAESGWLSKVTKRSARHTYAGVAELLEGLPHAFVHPGALPSTRDEVRRASFRMRRNTFAHFLEFGARMHPPTPTKAREAQTPERRPDLLWPAAARRLVRPFRGERRAPKRSTPASVSTLYAKMLRHCDWRQKIMPTIPQPVGVQETVRQIWLGARELGGEEAMDLYVAWLLLSYRALVEGDQSHPPKVEVLVNTLVDLVGLVRTIEIVRATFLVERDDRATPAPCPWWIPGWAFPPGMLHPDLWFQIRCWANHAAPADVEGMMAQLRIASDAGFLCAAALAVPDEPWLWREHVGALELTDEVGQIAFMARVRITSLVACARSVEEAAALFAAHPTMPNTYEYPTLAHALGAEGFALIGAQRPTDPHASYRQLVAMSVYQGPDATAWMGAQQPMDRHCHKVIEAYLATATAI